MGEAWCAAICYVSLISSVIRCVGHSSGVWGQGSQDGQCEGNKTSVSANRTPWIGIDFYNKVQNYVTVNRLLLSGIDR